MTILAARSPRGKANGARKKDASVRASGGSTRDRVGPHPTGQQEKCIQSPPDTLHLGENAMLRKLAYTLPVVSALFAVPNLAHAGTCGSVTSVASDIWQKYGSLAPALPYAKKVEEMIKFWNANVGNTWAFLGPRKLETDTTLKGSVIGQGDRVFIAPTPSNENSVTIKLDKIAGKAKTGVTVCSVSESGRAVKIWDFTAEKGAYTKTWSKTINGVKDKVITIHFDGHSASKKFKYELEVSQ